jgi:hypothetical protein
MNKDRIEKVKILYAIRKAGFKLVRNTNDNEYLLVEDYGKLKSNERLVK